MALSNPWPPPAEHEYDAVLEESFPASDPPPGVIKVGPRKPPTAARPSPGAPRRGMPEEPDPAD